MNNCCNDMSSPFNIPFEARFALFIIGLIMLGEEKSLYESFKDHFRDDISEEEFCENCKEFRDKMKEFEEYGKI